MHPVAIGGTGRSTAHRSGISLATESPERREQAGRLLNLLIDGLRPRP
ncbi:hypothetical protein ACRS5S_01335 [Nocardia asiatica]